MKFLMIVGIIALIIGLLLILLSRLFIYRLRRKRAFVTSRFRKDNGKRFADICTYIGTLIAISGLAVTLSTELHVRTIKKEMKEIKKVGEETIRNVQLIEDRLGIRIGVDGLPLAESTVFDHFSKGLKLMADGYWEEAIPEFKRSTKKAKYNQLATLYNLIGICDYAADRFDLALVNLGKSLIYARKVDDKETEARDFHYIGLIAARTGDLDKAWQYLNDALSIYKELGIEHQNGRIFIDLGLVYEAKGDLEDALTYLAEFFNFGESIPSDQQERLDSGYLGSLDKIKKTVHEVFGGSRRYLELNKVLGQKKDIAEHLNYVGLIYDYETVGSLDSARAFYEEVLQISRELSYKEGEANALGKIGMIFARGWQLDSALQYTEDALNLEKEIGDSAGEARQIRNIGIIYQRKGNWELAMIYYNNALRIDRDICYKEGEGVDLISLANIFDIRKERENALKYYKDALKIFTQIGAQREIGLVKGHIEILEKY